jgi:uncharacterized protein
MVQLDGTPPLPFAGLDGYAYCQLVSWRRDGTPVPTPVWFAVENGRLYIKTEIPSGKVRRIRNDGRVQVAPCTVRGRPLGGAVPGRGRVLGAWEEQVAERALRRRYGLVRRLFVRVVEPIFRLRGWGSVYLEVVPGRDTHAP